MWLFRFFLKYNYVIFYFSCISFFSSFFAYRSFFAVYTTTLLCIFLRGKKGTNQRHHFLLKQNNRKSYYIQLLHWLRHLATFSKSISFHLTYKTPPFVPRCTATSQMLICQHILLRHRNHCRHRHHLAVLPSSIVLSSTQQLTWVPLVASSRHHRQIHHQNHHHLNLVRY